LQEQTDNSIDESVALLKEWHGRAGGRIRYCFAPRFAISCTRELLERVASLARARGVMVHTHASENRTECELVQQESGLRNVAYLDSLGLTGSHVALAHCVHLNSNEIEILKTSRTNVVHCPSSNLKLGSGIAPIAKLLDEGVSVSLGADGAACNNRLDMFTEMRTAALLQKALHGPEVMSASRMLRMATIDGARALGLDSEIGSLELGKRADVAVVRLDRLHATPVSDVVSALVYSAEQDDVDTVIIDGDLLMRERKLLKVVEREIIWDAQLQRKILAADLRG
jgi:5-methylthioadenosine/S-adenosylhomocysteine deaminase